MKRGSWVRQAKRQSMKEKGNTFSQRVLEAVRTGESVQPVKFEFKANKKPLIDEIRT